MLRLYQDIGTALKHQFSGATAWIISSNEDALKCIGLKPSKRIRLMNGELECLFNHYELFQGEHKEWKNKRRDFKQDRNKRDFKPRGRRDEGDKKPFARKPGDRKPFARDNRTPRPHKTDRR